MSNIEKLYNNLLLKQESLVAKDNFSYSFSLPKISNKKIYLTLEILPANNISITLTYIPNVNNKIYALTDMVNDPSKKWLYTPVRFTNSLDFNYNSKNTIKTKALMYAYLSEALNDLTKVSLIKQNLLTTEDIENVVNVIFYTLNVHDLN